MLKNITTLSCLTLLTYSAISQIPCINGMSGGYPCENVEMLSFLDGENIGGGDMNDIWGWVDPEDGTEYAIIGRTNGTAFIDISDPLNPIYASKSSNCYFKLNVERHKSIQQPCIYSCRSRWSWDADCRSYSS